METLKTFTVEDGEAAKRLDVYLSERLSSLTRSGIKNLIKAGLVEVDGAPAKAGLALRGGEEVMVRVPPPPSVTLEPEPVPLEVLYEDEEIIVVNKPAGMPVHPGAGRPSGTLVNALLHHTAALSPVGAPLRPGIVHRLDMDTTGALVVARTEHAHRDLAAQFKAHTTERRYVALVWGTVKKDSGEIDAPIGRDVSHRVKISTRTRKARKAATHFTVLRRYRFTTLLELRPRTGRTHQIRVHLASINHPVVGDQLYGRRTIPPNMPKAAADMIRGIKRQLLHAATIEITHPATGQRMEFRASMPGDMGSLIKVLDETHDGAG